MSTYEDLKDYFDNNKGFGVLSTSNDKGVVDAAVYSRPHFMEDESLAFIMRDRLTHANLQSNPHALYLFKENGPGYEGKRLFLTKAREEENAALIQQLRRRSPTDETKAGKTSFLVYFKIDQVLPLIGAG